MSTKKMTLQSETFQRASDQVMVLSSKQLSDNIKPDSITMANSKYIILQNTSGDGDSYIIRDPSNNLIIANLLSTGGEVQLTHTMSSGNQRYLLLKEYGSTDTQAIQAPYTLTIVTENDDIVLKPDADIVFDEGGAIMMPNLPTSDPTNEGQLWNDSGTPKISAG